MAIRFLPTSTILHCSGSMVGWEVREANRASFIILGYRLYLSDTIATNMEKILDNVTFPSTTTTMLDRCHISFWSKAADWVLFTKFLDREKHSCEETRNETVEPQNFLDICMDKELDKDYVHINVKRGHNVSYQNKLGGIYQL